MSRRPSTEALLAQSERSLSEAAARVSCAATPAKRAAQTKIQKIKKHSAPDLKKFLGKMESHGAWASPAGGVSLVGGIYKVIKGGDTLAKNTWGRLSVANDFVIADCFTPGYATSANSIATKLEGGCKPEAIAMAPQQTFSQLLKGAITVDTAAR